MIQNGIEKILSKNPIIPVATIRNKEELESIIDKIIQANIQCIEVTLRTDFAYQALEIIKSLDTKIGSTSQTIEYCFHSGCFYR